VMCITSTSTLDFTIKADNDTPGLCYNHAGQIQLYGSEWKLVTYVNLSKLEAKNNTVLDFITQTKGIGKELSSQSISTYLSDLVLMEKSVSRVHCTSNIIFQIIRRKEDDTFSLDVIHKERESAVVFLILLGLFQRFYSVPCQMRKRLTLKTK
jgi:hypothetical protein